MDRIEDEISKLMQIYVPPEDEQPVRQAVVVSDGPVTRVWRVDGTARPRRERGEPSGGAGVARWPRTQGRLLLQST